MVKRLALVAALFAFAGLTTVRGFAAPVAIAQAASVAQASLPQLFASEDAAQAHVRATL